MITKTLNASFLKASKAKNDEFYTQLPDIEKELKHYKSQFSGKVVYCNCDDPFESNFFKYFAANFNALGLRKLITTSYIKSPIAGRRLPLSKIKGLKLEAGYSFKIEIKEVPDINGDGAVNLDDVEYLLKHDKNTAAPLKCTGDFRNKECIKLLKQADIVVTNPPFSLFREYIEQLIKYNKRVLILGNQNAVTYKEIFKLIKENKLWLGCDNSSMKWFQVPNYYNIQGKSGVKIVGGVKYQGMGNIAWFTNLNTPKRREKLVSYKKYKPEDYPKYDNYDAINVDRYTEIPMDYTGVMGVPVTFIDKLNPEQFEILDITDRLNTSGLRTKKYTLKDSPRYSDLNRRGAIRIGSKLQAKYARLLIKRKMMKN